MLGAPDGHAFELVCVAPVADRRCQVKHRAGATHRRDHRRAIGDVAAKHLHRLAPFDGDGIARQRQRAQLLAELDQALGQPATDESGGTGDEHRGTNGEVAHGLNTWAA
jgi:hypothetical protein